VETHRVCSGVVSKRNRSFSLRSATANRPEFDEFVSAHGTSLLRAAYLLVGDRGHAEDLVQMTLVRMASHWQSAREAPRPYAHRVLINLSRNHIRDAARRPRVASRPAAESQAPVSDDISQVEDRQVLTRALRQLPDQQREIAIMRFILDLSVSETAILLQVPEGTVKSATHRALRGLREHLEAAHSSLPLEVGHVD
jgi:RNA polymerase sigma-70 factor (sigma-E family)